MIATVTRKLKIFSFDMFVTCHCGLRGDLRSLIDDFHSLKLMIFTV